METEDEDGTGFNPRRTVGIWHLKISVAVTQIGIAISSAQAMFRTRARDRSAKSGVEKSKRFTLCNICTVGMLATYASAVQASPLSTTSFDQFASRCAPGVKLSTLRAVAAVESHFQPLAIRDNTTRESLTPKALLTAIALARRRVTMGHSVDIGLMQINSGNLPSLDMSVEDAFDECHSLAAGSRILRSALTAGSSETERQAAIMISLSRYNTGRALAGIANGYASEVIAAQNELLNDKQARLDTQNTLPQWDIWNTTDVESTSWVVTAGQSSEIEKAGAQTSDARNEGRAPASPSEKGGPYELSAYQESEPNKP